MMQKDNSTLMHTTVQNKDMVGPINTRRITYLPADIKCDQIASRYQAPQKSLVWMMNHLRLPLVFQGFVFQEFDAFPFHPQALLLLLLRMELLVVFEHDCTAYAAVHVLGHETSLYLQEMKYAAFVNVLWVLFI